MLEGETKQRPPSIQVKNSPMTCRRCYPQDITNARRVRESSAVIRRFLVFVGLCAATSALAEPPGVPLKDSVPHMTTTGEAEAEVRPDQADLRLGVRQERKTADAATEATAKAADTVIAAIKAQGVEPADIHTSFSVSETFDTRKDDKNQVVSRAPRGYEAYEGIAVRVRDIAKVGPLARALIAGGGDTFEGVRFTYSKARQRRQDLKTEAMRDALAKARIYTDAIGLKLGRVLQIGEEPMAPDGEADLPSRRALPGDGAPIVVPIEPGLQTLRASVTVVWQIEGAAR